MKIVFAELSDASGVQAIVISATQESLKAGQPLDGGFQGQDPGLSTESRNLH